MSSPMSDEILRLMRLEGHIGRIAARVPRMQEELECLKDKLVELTRGFSTMKKGLVYISDFLELRNMIGRHEATIASLRQARLDTLPPTLSHGPAESSRAPVPVYSGNRSTLSNFLKLFQSWTKAHDAGNTLVTSEPIRVVGKERAELDNACGREKVNQSIAVWTELVKVIERRSPSEAWKLLLSKVSESSEAARDKAKKEFKELTFEIGKQSIRDYVARAKAMVMKLEQNNVTTTKKEINRRILNGLHSAFNVEKKMFLMMADTEPDELGEALARIEDSRMND